MAPRQVPAAGAWYGRMLLVATCLAVLAAPRAGMGQSVVSLLPLGVQRGAVTEVRLVGTNLAGVQALFTCQPGISARRLANDRFAITVAGDVPDGDHDVWALGTTGLSQPRRITVSGLPELVEREKNDTPATAQAVPLPAAVSGTIEPGTDRDHYGFDLGAGQPVTLAVRSLTLDGSVRPAVTLFDPAGREVLHDTGKEAEPLLHYRAREPGRHVLRVEERAFRQEPGNHYRLELSTGPRLVGVVPDLFARGQTQAAWLHGYQLPGGDATPALAPGLERLRAEVAAPRQGDADGGGWTLPSAAFLESFRYRRPGWTGALRLGLAEQPVVSETDSAHQTAQTAQPLTLPCTVAGRLLRPGEVDWYHISVQAGQLLAIEASSDPGSRAVDLEVAIHDAKGKLLTTLGDVAPPKGLPATLPLDTLDPVGTWKAPAAGTYFVAIRDLHGPVTGELGRSYRLSIGPRREAYRVLALPAPVPLVTPGKSVTLQLVVLRRGGHQAPIHLRASSLPPGLRAPEIALETEQATATWTLTAAADVPAWIGRLSLRADSVTDGQPASWPVLGTTLVREGKQPVARLSEGIVAAIAGK